MVQEVVQLVLYSFQNASIGLCMKQMGLMNSEIGVLSSGYECKYKIRKLYIRVITACDNLDRSLCTCSMKIIVL